MVDDEPAAGPAEEHPDGLQDPVLPEEPQAPVPKRADVLRDFRKTLADRHRPGGGKSHKPAGGNPRFR